MTETTCWQTILEELRSLEVRLVARVGRTRPGAYGIGSLQEDQSRATLEFIKAILEDPEALREDRLFAVEEILCGRLANEKSLTEPARLLHESFGYQIYSRESLAAMKQGKLFARFGFPPCGL